MSSSAERLRELALVAALNVAALGAALATVRDPRLGAVAVVPAPTATVEPTATSARLHVYVSGAVATPDVVQLAEGARAQDAVRAAGGFAGEADRAAINLAAPLADGQQLHVPAKGEAPATVAGLSAAPMSAPAVGASGGALTTAAASGAPPGASSGGAAPSGGALVDVNRATAAELEALPGVGPALAARIIAYREANGPFASADDLDAVSGIGARTLERLRPFVAVR